MHPLIRDQDVLIVAPLDRPARIGDILLYVADRRPVAHRLVAVGSGKDGLFFALKGDSASAPDLPVRPDRVVGRVFAVERNGRRFDPYNSWTAACCLPRKLVSGVKSVLLKVSSVGGVE